MLAGGFLSYGSYELVSLVGWLSSAKQIGGVELSFKQYLAMQADFQRSRFWQKEYGGFLLTDGDFQRFPRAWRHNYGLGPEDDTGILIPKNARAMYHTHWDKAGRTIIVDQWGNDIEKLSVSEKIHASGIKTSETARLHGPYDFYSIDSFVINRYETSFSVGGTKVASPFADSFLRYFLMYPYIML